MYIQNSATSSKVSETSKNSDKYSLELNVHSNEYSFRNERIFVWLFRTNIRIFGIFVLALISEIRNTVLGGNMHKTPRYRYYFMCTKWFLRRLGPHSPLPHLKRLVCMKMNKNVPNFPLIERFPIYRDRTYRGSTVLTM